MPSYLLPATACPPLVTPAALLRPGTDTAPSARKITTGDTTSGTDSFNENATRLDVTGRRGGGAYAVTEGLDLTPTALVCAVSAGQAMIDGPATWAGGNLSGGLADNAYNWIWLLQNGTPAKTTSATATPVPAAPSTACAFLGRIQVTAGTPGTPDYSGRWELRNGTLWRRTGDAGIPGDTPAAALLFVTQTAGGSYLWDGTAYRRLAETLVTEPRTIGVSEAVTIPSDRQAVLSELTINGTVQIDGLLVFV